jgi:hypothetical protein
VVDAARRKKAARGKTRVAGADDDGGDAFDDGLL